MHKRSQMEIMGIAIVIILVTIGMLFVVRFVLTEKQPDLRQEYMETQLAANLLNALLQTNAPDCHGKQIKSLFRDCALTNQIRCQGDIHSCQYLNQTVYRILNMTLMNWNKRFNFNATNTNENFAGGIQFGRACQGDTDRKFYPIQAQSKTVMVNLEICSLS